MTMRLVVDTNVIIAAAIARGKTLDVLYKARLDLMTPEFAETELSEHLEEIVEKSGLDKTELQRLFEAIFMRTMKVKAREYAAFRSKAEEISPDKQDWPFFAVALKENCTIWSNDKRLKKQSAVRIIGTGELVKLLAAVGELPEF